MPVSVDAQTKSRPIELHRSQWKDLMDLAIKIAVTILEIAAAMAIVMFMSPISISSERSRFHAGSFGPDGGEVTNTPADCGQDQAVFKEDIIPSGAVGIIFSMAPILTLVPALISFAVIPLEMRATAFSA